MLGFVNRGGIASQEARSLSKAAIDLGRDSEARAAVPQMSSQGSGTWGGPATLKAYETGEERAIYNETCSQSL